MKISLTKLFAQDGKSEKYEIPLTSETFSIGGQDYRVIEKHPVILGLTHEGNRVITITGSADLTMEIPCARCLTPVASPSTNEESSSFSSRSSSDRFRSICRSNLSWNGVATGVRHLAHGISIVRSALPVIVITRLPSCVRPRITGCFSITR